MIPDVNPASLAAINQWREARALSEVTAGQIWLQMAHRFMAALISLGVVASWFAQRRGPPALEDCRVCGFLLVVCQVTLGAWVIWSNKAADIATAHVAVGASMLAVGVAFVTLSLRSRTGEAHRSHESHVTYASERSTRVVRDLRATSRELVKARLTMLVLLTTAAGYYLGAERGLDWLQLFHAVFGTALAAAGAAALNQWWERRLDALMHRTRTRPIPAGRMLPRNAFIVGAVLSVVGVGYLAILCNWLSAFSWP